jgi:hypothetical protein
VQLLAGVAGDQPFAALLAVRCRTGWWRHGGAHCSDQTRRCVANARSASILLLPDLRCGIGLAVKRNRPHGQNQNGSVGIRSITRPHW